MQVDRERLYRVSAVADLLDVSKPTVYRAVSSGELDSLRIGDAIRIPGEALADWLGRCGYRLVHPLERLTKDPDAALRSHQ